MLNRIDVPRAHNVLPFEYDGGAARRASFWGSATGVDSFKVLTRKECRQRINGARNLLA